MTKVTALLLTAGESRRMGRENKLLMPFQERTLVRYVTEELLRSNISECIVVTGYQAPMVIEALDGLEMRFVENTDFYSGIISSICAGMSLIDDESQGFIVCLSDMPHLKAMHYNALISKFEKSTPEASRPIIRPEHRERKGHPVLFHRSYIPDILKYKEKEDYEGLLLKNEEFLVRYPLANEAYYTDINTLKDYYKHRE